MIANQRETMLKPFEAPKFTACTLQGPETVHLKESVLKIKL